MRILGVLTISLFSIANCIAASFDCAKAGTSVEKAICGDKRLSRMDEVMADNYKFMLGSNIGDGAIKDLRSSQRAWMANRNKCLNNQCIAKSYIGRIDEICTYPVISGVHPVCISADEVLTELDSGKSPRSK